MNEGVIETDDRGESQARVHPVQTRCSLSGLNDTISDSHTSRDELQDRLNRSQLMLKNLHKAVQRAQQSKQVEPSGYADMRASLIEKLQQQMQQDREELQEVEKQELLRPVQQFTLTKGGVTQSQSLNTSQASGRSATRTKRVIDRFMKPLPTEVKPIVEPVTARTVKPPPVTRTEDHNVSISSIGSNPPLEEEEEKRIISNVWGELKWTHDMHLLREGNETNESTSMQSERGAQRPVNGNRDQDPMDAAGGLTSHMVGNMGAPGARGASVKSNTDAQGETRTCETERQDDHPVRPGAGAAGTSPAQSPKVPIGGIVLDREEREMQESFQALHAQVGGGRSSTPHDANVASPGSVKMNPAGLSGDQNWCKTPVTESRATQTEPDQLNELVVERRELEMQLTAAEQMHVRALSTVVQQCLDEKTALMAQSHRELQQLRFKISEMQSEHDLELSRKQRECQLRIQTVDREAHDRYEGLLAKQKESAELTQLTLREELKTLLKASDCEKESPTG